MTGKDHFRLGAIFSMAAGPTLAAGLAAHRIPMPTFTPGRFLILIVLSAGAALIPDLDHPSAAAGRSLPGGQAVAGVIRDVSGGHRHLTHGLLGAAGITAAAWWGCGQGPLAVAIATFVLLAMATHLEWLHHMVKSMVVAAAGTALVMYAAPPGRWLAVAVGLGCVSHIAGDCLNPQRCPLFCPLKIRLGIPLFTTTEPGKPAPKGPGSPVLDRITRGRGEKAAGWAMNGGLLYLAWLRW